MTALVLAGGFPQINLIEKLKKRGIKCVLADYYENPVARAYADVFYRISTLDVPAITQLAIDEKVDFLITVCTDQSLLTVAQVSEALGLPCYLDYKTALNVTNKAYMKSVFSQNCIPTAKHVIISDYNEFDANTWKFPLIVKPVDCNSSKGVKKVFCDWELKDAISEAVKLSRSHTAIVEEFIEGKELSVDVYVDNGNVSILDITTSEKIQDNSKFVIFRTWHPADISPQVEEKVFDVCQKIADSFALKNSPMLVQLITDGVDVYVLEFSARTGGGVKHLSIARRTGVDIIDTVIELTLGNKPTVSVGNPISKYMLDEYIYCAPGEYDHMEGFDTLKEKQELLDYYIFRSKGSRFDKIENSGDRLAGFTIIADSLDDLERRHNLVNTTCKAISADGKDIMRHDLLGTIM